jgi:hypothetical protein
MLKTITEFVLQRRTRVHQPRRQVLEDDDTRDPGSVSEVPTQPAEPHIAAIPRGRWSRSSPRMAGCSTRLSTKASTIGKAISAVT